MDDRGRRRFMALIDERCGMPKSVAEVGVLHPTHSYVEKYADMGVKTLLVDPQPFAAEACRSRWGGTENVRVVQAAIVDKPGMHVLLSPVGAPIDHLGGSYLAGVRGPQEVRKEGGGGKPWAKPAQELPVVGIHFDRVDPGDLDAINVDTEGSEWFVFKRMVSRPKVISFERDHWKSSTYVTPHVEEIEGWLEREGYESAGRYGFDVFYVRS